MQSLWDSGIYSLSTFQTITWLVLPMAFFSFLGSEEFFLFLLPLAILVCGYGAGLARGIDPVVQYLVERCV